MSVKYLNLLCIPHRLICARSIFSRSLSSTPTLIRSNPKQCNSYSELFVKTPCNRSRSDGKLPITTFRQSVGSLTGTNSDQLGPAGPKTVDDVRRAWTGILEKNDIPESQISVDYVIAHILGEKTLHMVSGWHELSQQQVECVNALCQQRLQRKPVQYILGEWDFHYINLKLKPPVFIPRPETEELVELAIRTVETKGLHHGHLLELCCGSGAIILSLLNTFPQLCGVAVDISPEACSLTQENAQRLGLSDRLTVLCGDLAESQVQESLKEMSPFDLLVSNPPYMSTEQMSSLEPEILQYENHRALDGGVDGLDVVRCILHTLPQLMNPECDVILEIQPGQPEVIEAIVTSVHPSTLQYISSYQDVCDRTRFCHLRTL